MSEAQVLYTLVLLETLILGGVICFLNIERIYWRKMFHAADECAREMAELVGFDVHD